MKFTRRNFIQVIMGGAAGIALSPLPWKLTDDIAIWTQNWPWLPVPPTGEVKNINTICTLCDGGCGIVVRTVGGRAVKIEGNKDYPINQGSLCPLGVGGIQLLYNSDIRFHGPSLLKGSRHSGDFHNISWKDAVSALADRLNSLANQDKLDQIAIIDGTPAESTISELIRHFAEILGTPNYIKSPSMNTTAAIASGRISGKDIAAPFVYDMENSDFILSFGSGLLEGWAGAGRMHNTWNIWRQGQSLSDYARTKIIQIEPRVSVTASKADKWIAIKPGTESALALGLAHIIIKENRYDKNNISRHTKGFDQWAEHVLTHYTPETISKLTGVSEKEIILLAREFSEAEAPLAVCGKGAGIRSDNTYDFMTVYALNMLAGSFNRKGGMLSKNRNYLNKLNDFESDPFSGTKPIGSGNTLHAFTEAILKNNDNPIDTILVFSDNPAYSMPDGGLFREALEKIPFIVSFSPYKDETALMADLVLPDHTYLEKTDDIYSPSWVQYPFYAVSQPAVDPVYDTKNMGDTIIAIVNALPNISEKQFKWKTYEEIMAYRARPLFDNGMGYTELSHADPWNNNSSKGKMNYGSFKKFWNDLKGGFWFLPQEISDTVSFEFADDFFTPVYIQQNGEDGSLPLVIYDILNLPSGRIAPPPFLSKNLFEDQLYRNDSFIEIHPDTAYKFSLRTGEKVMLISDRLKAEVRVSVFEGVSPNAVFIPAGLGHTAFDEFFKDKGVNPYSLIQPESDPLSGESVWWNTRVKLIKIH